MGITQHFLSVPRAAVLAVMVAAATSQAAGLAVPTVAVAGAATQAGFELDGVAQPLRQATVAAQTAGNVLALLAKAGDTVRAGQVLARVDEREAQAGLSRSDAAVSQAEAELRNARLQVERLRELRTKGFVSQSALDMAETQLQAAQAGVQQAQGARSQAALAKGFATLSAPFDGVVQATHLEAGDLASPGRPVLTLHAPGAMRAVVQVPASRAALARQAGMPRVQLPDGRWVLPVRKTELPTTDPVAQTVEWRLDLAADVAAQLSPGQNLRVRFEGAAPAHTQPVRSAPLLPASAILRRGELTAVYVAQGSQFVLRAVRTGASLPNGVEVLAGLKPQERVAVDAVRAGLAGAMPTSVPVSDDDR